MEKPVKNTRVHFDLTMVCAGEAEITVYDIAVVLLRQSSLKVQDNTRKNDCFLEFFLKSEYVPTWSNFTKISWSELELQVINSNISNAQSHIIG